MKKILDKLTVFLYIVDMNINNMEVIMITKCPFCGGALQIRELSCNRCGVKIQGKFPYSVFFQLSPEQMEFVKIFLKSRGNIKEVEKELGISYPTVRARLNAVLGSIGIESDTEAPKRVEILDALSRGEIDAAQAVEQLKKL